MARACVPVAVSELHGGMCGLLCAGGASAVPEWVEECLVDSDPVEGALDAARDQLRKLELYSWRSLTGSGLEFYPLLPDDDAMLGERVGALALWCHGFLSGLGLGGFSLEREKTSGSDAGPLEEIVNDFSEISRAAAEADEFDDEDQAGFALAELIEYVRVGVQIVFEELEPKRATSPGTATIH
jgi:uncharacterized protein YgfB (UPF0149 family)